MDTTGQTIAAASHAPYKAPQMITGAQIRAARALIGWTSQRLAAESGINYATISRAEQTDGIPPVRAQTLAALQTALERAGVVFLSDGDTRSGGAGVRLR